MRVAVEQARTRGERRSPEVERSMFIACYEVVLATGLAANLPASPPPKREPSQRGQVKQSPARNLLERLWLGTSAGDAIPSAYLLRTGSANQKGRQAYEYR